MTPSTPLPMKSLRFTDGFWAAKQALLRGTVLPTQWEVFEHRMPAGPPGHALKNLRLAAGIGEGEFGGFVFQDSDLAKWIEGAAYAIALQPDSVWQARLDEVAGLYEQAQEPDGYVNPAFQLKNRDKRWTNLRDEHELYCAGHLTEGAVALAQATGDDRLLNVCRRYLALIGSLFGDAPGKRRGVPGHPELELALIRLYEYDGDPRYLEQARYFLEARGQEPHYFYEEAVARGETPGTQHLYQQLTQYQAHKPIREQSAIVGHSVRALYLFAGAAGLARHSDDAGLAEVCRTIWASCTRRRMYVTGGVGSTQHGECFTVDFDLPNETAYAETCASIALVFFAHRMLQLELDADYADVMERALYNGILSGVGADGRSYRYDNPLTFQPDTRRWSSHHPAARQSWFPCACCPPNLLRLVLSLERYAVARTADGLAVHLYGSCDTSLDLDGQTVAIRQRTRYPWDGRIEIAVEPESAASFALALRLPGWCRAPRLTVNGEAVDLPAITTTGYAHIRRDWAPGDRVQLDLPMPVERLEAHPGLREDVGRVALQRGPIVYAVEQIDNGEHLADLRLPRGAAVSETWDPDFLGGAVLLHATGQRRATTDWDDALYRSEPTPLVDAPIRAIPYALWGNRDLGEMRVWLQE